MVSGDSGMRYFHIVIRNSTVKGSSYFWFCLHNNANLSHRINKFNYCIFKNFKFNIDGDKKAV